MRRAVIDVGTNSVKLLVADVTGREIEPVWEGSTQTRLGQGFYQTRHLQPTSIEQTASAVTAFVSKAKECNASGTRIIATSAARDATNSSDLVSAIERACGLPPEIITGEQEADWVFQGVTSDPALAELPLLLLDVGGGSTEFILGCGNRKHFRHSYHLGTVRLMETDRSCGEVQLAQPLGVIIRGAAAPGLDALGNCRQWLRLFLARELEATLAPAMEREKRLAAPAQIQLIGTGGTATILGCIKARLETFDRQKLEATRVSLAWLRTEVDHLWQLPAPERKKIVGLPANRSDVILTGAAIYEAIMDSFGFSELRISTRGLRYAAVMEVVSAS